MKNAVVSGLVTGLVVVVGLTVDWGAVSAGVTSLSWANINEGARVYNRFFLLLVAVPVVVFSVGQRIVDSVSGCNSRSLLWTASQSTLEIAVLLVLVWFSYVV